MKVKQTLKVLISSILIVFTFISIPSCQNNNNSTSSEPAEEDFDECLVYEIVNDEVVITGYLGSPTKIVISHYVVKDGTKYPVTTINDVAFSKCASLTSILIPNSITTIGRFAFNACHSLAIYCETNEQPSSWDKTWNAFRPVYYGVRALDIIELDTTHYLIQNDKAILTNYFGLEKNVIIPSSIDVNKSKYDITSIGNFAFSYSKIESVELPNSITSIGDHAFFECSSLTNIIIPNSVTSIGDGAFGWCHSLKSIEIPSSVTAMGYTVFSSCDILKIYSELDKQPTTWDEEWNDDNLPVYWGTSIKDIIIYDGLQFVLKDNEAILVDGNKSGYKIEIPASIYDGEKTYNVTSIGEKAFYRSFYVESIEIPTGIKKIGNDAFKSCHNLNNIYIDSIESWLNIEFSNQDANPLSNNSPVNSCNLYIGSVLVYNIEIPSNVTSINNYAFYSYYTLEKVKLHDNVTSIGEQAFAECKSLESIVIPSNVIDLGQKAFYECESLTIYCEIGLQPSGWSDSWNYSKRPVYWVNEWHYDENGNPVPNN